MISKYIAVGFEDGYPEFEVSGLVAGLSLESMNELRQMTIVAIGTMEDMWRRNQESRIRSERGLVDTGTEPRS